MVDILDQQWLDQNSQRSYPLFDEATRLDTSGLFTLPNDLIVDLRIAAPPSYGATGWFVSQVAAYGAGLIIITISCTGQGAVATVVVPLSGFTEFSTYTVTPLPGNPQVGGSIVIGSALAMLASSAGQYSFVQAATQILPTVVFPAAPSVSSITFVDSFGGSTVLTGAVTLQGGSNASLSIAGQIITIGMQSGVVLEDPCPGCVDQGGLKRLPIRSINGVSPDTSGNIQLQGTGCLSITPGQYQLILNDTCAQPCCGTPELDLLAQNVQTISTLQQDLTNRIAAVEAGLRQVDSYYTL
jgi:hypothetical protein